MTPRGFGWDIGGVHLKAALLLDDGGEMRLVWRERPFAIWRAPTALPAAMVSLMDDLLPRAAAAGRAIPHAVTFTAELSDCFASREAGVAFILDACDQALGGEGYRVLDVEGGLRPPGAARRTPLAVAAANWMATAMLAARFVPDGVLIDTGSTTTDIVPLRTGRPRPLGRGDTERLQCGELLYTGGLRTPPSSLGETVPVRGAPCPTIPEFFCNMADAYVLLGRLEPGAYTVETADGRGRDRAACAVRLARLVGASPADLGEDGLLALAAFLEERQIARVAAAVRRAAPGARTAVTCGAGEFLAEAAARSAGLDTVRLEALHPRLGPGWSRVAPAASLALRCGV
jgi:probable H4MPT-linked C1 transfer pathway protein